MIFLFTGESGAKVGYTDNPHEKYFPYSGEGQRGDMKMIRGNRAIRDHLENGYELHLFKSIGAGLVEYLGDFFYGGHETRTELDSTGALRLAFCFQLIPGQQISNDPSAAQEDATIKNASLEDIAKQMRLVPEQGTVNEALVTLRARCNTVRRYALKRASGVCEACHEAAPFINLNGEPFLEVHHIGALSLDDRADRIDNVAAICPNCHRRAHYGTDRDEYNQNLRVSVDDWFSLHPSHR
jgi:5-methylcytosine-specific restriction protein A